MARPITASMLPAALLALLPKCPLCLAAWLTAMTGVSISTTWGAGIRGSLELACVGALIVTLWKTALRLLQRLPDPSSADR